MNWKLVSYNRWDSPPYTITAHMDLRAGVPFFIAYWGDHILAGACESAEAAREVCRQHAEWRS